MQATVPQPTVPMVLLSAEQFQLLQMQNAALVQRVGKLEELVGSVVRNSPLGSQANSSQNSTQNSIQANSITAQPPQLANTPATTARVTAAPTLGLIVPGLTTLLQNPSAKPVAVAAAQPVAIFAAQPAAESRSAEKPANTPPSANGSYVPPDPIKHINDLITQKKYPEAEAFIHLGLAKNPHSNIAYHSLAAVERHRGNLDLATALLNVANILKPDCGDTYEALGTISLQKGDYKQAKAHFEKAYDLDKNTIQALIGMALACRKLKEYPEARKHYNEILKHDAANKQAKHGLALIAYDLKEYEEAQRLLNENLKEHPNYKDSTQLLAHLKEIMANKSASSSSSSNADNDRPTLVIDDP